MEKQINEIRDLIQEIAWRFGDHEFNGECCGGLTFVEFMALKKIDESEYLSIQEVGRALNFTKSGATRLVNRLQTKKYIKREQSSKDGRVCCITLSSEGRNALNAIAGKYGEYLEKVLRELDQEQTELLGRILQLLANIAKGE